MRKHCGCGIDLDLATHVQQLLLPKSSPLCGWCCIGTRNRMAQGLGGDFFDFISLPDEKQAVFIGDVTGHGLHASLVMSLLYGFLHSAARDVASPVDMVRQANFFLQSFATRSREFDHFFSSTLFCGIIDPRVMRMEFVNAGHPAPLVRRGGALLTLPSTGPPIGFFDDPEIGLGSFSFEHHDRHLLFTDGLTDSVNGEGDFFGRERLQELLLRHRGDHLTFLSDLFAILQAFGADEPPGDDCTAIVIDFS